MNYIVWPDATWISEDDFAESEFQHMSDDWLLLSLPDFLDDQEVGAACLQAVQGGMYA